MSPFSGFGPQTIQFLDELAANNNREWFQANKDRYESTVREPALAFVAAMQKPLAKISPHFPAVVKKVGGSLMRVYRDTRFSQDKTPYKTNIGIHFRHEKGKDVHAPGYYLHIAPDECFLGSGIWHPDSATLAKIRKKIDKDRAGWKKAAYAKSFTNAFELAGDSLKRPPKGFDKEHPLIDDLKRKDFVGVARLELDEVLDPQLVSLVCSRFRKSSPLMQFLCAANRLKF